MLAVNTQTAVSKCDEWVSTVKLDEVQWGK